MESWSVEQKKIMDHFDDFTGGEKNWFASSRYIFGQNTPNDYWGLGGLLFECEVIFNWLDVIIT